jgi:hypothetical protein
LKRSNGKSRKSWCFHQRMTRDLVTGVTQAIAPSNRLQMSAMAPSFQLFILCIIDSRVGRLGGADGAPPAVLARARWATELDCSCWHSGCTRSGTGSRGRTLQVLDCTERVRPSPPSRLSAKSFLKTVFHVVPALYLNQVGQVGQVGPGPYFPLLTVPYLGPTVRLWMCYTGNLTRISGRVPGIPSSAGQS